MRSELQSIIDGLASRLGVPTSLTDSHFNSIVFGPHEDDDIDQVRRQALLNRQTSPRVREWFESFGAAHASGPVRIPADAGMAAKSRVIIPARWGTITYGFLCLLDDRYQLHDEDLAVAEAAMPEVARLLLKQHRDRQRGADTLLTLLSPVQSERDEAAAELRMAKGNLSTRVAVLRFASAVDELTVERNIDEVLRRASSRSRPVLRFVEGGRAVFLLMATSEEQSHSLMNELAEQCAGLSDQKCRVVAGIGDENEDFNGAIASLEQAELAARAAGSLGTKALQVVEWSKLGALRILVSAPPGRLAAALDPRFTALLASRDSSLIPTLEVYLDNAGHVQQTADALGIHRGTLYYRLRKAQEESGFDLANGLDVLSVHLAIKSSALLGSQRRQE
jgi:sugar diacid utilization regulator